jgi:hypothetical protein
VTTSPDFSLDCDEKLAFFITSLPAGRHEFRHVLYPEIEGRMLALPAAAWPMYQPELRGESAPWQFSVNQPGGLVPDHTR